MLFSWITPFEIKLRYWCLCYQSSFLFVLFFYHLLTILSLLLWIVAILRGLKLEFYSIELLSFNRIIVDDFVRIIFKVYTVTLRETKPWSLHFMTIAWFLKGLLFGYPIRFIIFCITMIFFSLKIFTTISWTIIIFLFRILYRRKLLDFESFTLIFFSLFSTLWVIMIPSWVIIHLTRLCFHIYSVCLSFIRIFLRMLKDIKAAHFCKLQIIVILGWNRRVNSLTLVWIYCCSRFLSGR